MKKLLVSIVDPWELSVSVEQPIIGMLTPESNAYGQRLVELITPLTINGAAVTRLWLTARHKGASFDDFGAEGLPINAIFAQSDDSAVVSSSGIATLV